MGQFGGLTQPGSALMDQNGRPMMIGSPQQALAATQQFLPQGDPSSALNPSGASSSPLPSIGTPSFAQAASAGATTPGGLNVFSGALSKAGKLGVLLSSGLQGAMAGQAASAQAVLQSGGKRGGSFGGGFEAAQELPWQRAMQGQELQHSTLENQAAQMNLQPVQTPWGQMPLSRASQMAGLQKDLAETNAKGFVTPRGGGVYDTRTQSYAPGAAPTPQKPSSPDEQTFAYLTSTPDPRLGRPMTPDEAYQTINTQKNQTKDPTLAPNDVTQLNAVNTRRYQVLNPGQQLPSDFRLPTGATAKDYDRIDKGLTQLESAQGTKAQRDATNQITRQNQQDREDTQSRKWVTWTDPQSNRTVAGPLSMAKQMNAENPADLDNRDVQAVQDARGAVSLINKRGDPSKPETWGVSQLIDSLDKDGKLGIGTSRLNSFLTGGVGAAPGDDPRIPALLNKTQLLMTLSMKAHFGASGGRSPQMLEHFLNMANAKKMNAATLRAGINSVGDYMNDRAMIPAQGGQGGGASAQPNGVDPVAALIQKHAQR